MKKVQPKKKVKRKLFVLIGHFDYEGYDQPEGIFTTRAKAEAFKREHVHPRSYDDIDIIEYTLNPKSRHSAHCGQ